jgi:hypothetical protein
MSNVRRHEMQEPKSKCEAHASEKTPWNWSGVKRVAHVPLRRGAVALRKGRYERLPLVAKESAASGQTACSFVAGQWV